MFTEYQTEIIFIVSGLLGGVMHYFKKMLKKQTDVSLSEWFGKSNWVATLYTLIMFIFAMVGALAADVVNSQTGLWAAMYAGFVTGFAIDSGFNSDQNTSKVIAQNKAEIKDMMKKL